MAEETLISAARRVVRFSRIDQSSGGGLISLDTVKAVETLDRQLRAAALEKPPENPT